MTGKACFFVAGKPGARGASGKPADPGELVAAHATLPLGSRVKVINLSNGKALEVRIVDRIPPSDRIISVSETAARQLGFLQAGTAQVRLEPAEEKASAAANR